MTLVTCFNQTCFFCVFNFCLRLVLKCFSHPEQQSSVSIIKPFYSELEILEDTLPQSETSLNWYQTGADWNHDTQLNSMEQKLNSMEHKCVTTLQYTHVHPPLQGLQQQQQQQQLQLQQPLLNSLVHIPHSAFKQNSDR